MSARPLCRNCGRPIAKKTTEVAFGLDKPGHAYQSARPERPTSRAEAQRLVNGLIVSVRKGYGDRRDEIAAANVWDGETYVDEAFDTETCAAAFGRAMARLFPAWSMPDYQAALAAQRAKA